MELLKTLKRRPSRLGVDIGESGTRIVQLDRIDDVLELVAVARTDRSRSADPSDDERDRAPVARRVATCLATGRFRGDRAAAALNAPDLVYHTLELPASAMATGGAEAQQVVHWELIRMLGESAESMETAYWPLPKSASAAAAIGVATPAARITECVDACAGAGLHCQCVDAAAAALCRFGGVLRCWSDGEIWGILDLGYRQSRLTLCVDETPVLVRQAGSGGQVWTERIAKALDVSASSAETHKRQHGIDSTQRGVRHGESAPPAIDLGGILLSAMRSELKAVTTEIKRSYEYVLGCHPTRNAGDLILVGGGAAMKRLPEFLSDALGIAARRASSFLDRDDCRLRGVGAVGGNIEPLAAAIGLAIEP